MKSSNIRYHLFFGNKISEKRCILRGCSNSCRYMAVTNMNVLGDRAARLVWFFTLVVSTTEFWDDVGKPISEDIPRFRLMKLGTSHYIMINPHLSGEDIGIHRDSVNAG